MLKRPLVVLLFVLIPLSAFADDYSINITIGDGSSGRPFQKWKQPIREGKVSSVSIRLQKVSGGGDAYVNLRFEGGQTFENGKRVKVPDNNERTVTWNVGGQRPNGRPLVLNAYKGAFKVKSAVVNFENEGSAAVEPPVQTQPVPKPAPKTLTGNVGATDEQALALCRDPNKRIRRPRIEVDSLRPSGGLFSGKYRINGVVSGQCIEEAGYFEGTRMKDDLNVPLSDRFDRYEFSFQVRGGRRGEIRVFTIDGRDDVLDVDEEIKAYERNR